MEEGTRWGPWKSSSICPWLSRNWSFVTWMIPGCSLLKSAASGACDLTSQLGEGCATAPVGCNPLRVFWGFSYSPPAWGLPLPLKAVTWPCRSRQPCGEPLRSVTTGGLGWLWTGDPQELFWLITFPVALSRVFCISPYLCQPHS